MGLFDIFKKREKQDEIVATDPYFLEALQTRIIARGYTAEKLSGRNALIVNGELEIATSIFIPEYTHWTLLHVMVLVSHPQYFPAGISKRMDGLGNTLEKRVYSAIDTWLESYFCHIIECVSGKHNPRFDIFTPNGKAVLCHSNPCVLIWHGRWIDPPKGEPVFDLLQDALKTKLEAAGIFSWVHVGFSNFDGTANGVCEFNDEHWQEGFDIIKKYVAGWEEWTDIRGVEQFIIFRRCDNIPINQLKRIV
jgi:hypothetical protein